MAKKNKAAPVGVVLFDVVYEDGTLSSNRKVPSSELGGLDGDAPAKAYIEAQDREVGEKSGRPRGKIKSITRASKRAAIEAAKAKARARG
jgi:hypothetical protein